MTGEDIKKIKKICQEFFEKMGFFETLKVGKVQEKTLPVELEVEEPQVLIGQGGQRLLEIQRLLQAILKRKFDFDFYLDLDINDYKKKKKEYLKELAQTTADQVTLLKKAKELPPMPAYERRVIHLELATRQDITTESIGKEPERRVVVKPYP
jgi:spoIIIJ-associated protein